MGCPEAGAEYCRHLDASISRGFNPYLGYVVDQTLHEADCCIHRLTSGPISEGSEKGKNPAGLKSFEYHCAHSFFQSEGEKVNQLVLKDFVRDYGKEMADTLWSYRAVNFNVCD